MTSRRAQRRTSQVKSTGIKVEARHRHHAAIPEITVGKHLWIVGGVWQVADPAAEHFQLDIENLLTLEGPGCWVCERPYTPLMASAPCRGPGSAP